MKAILRTFKAERGDCITFQIIDGENTYNILIDCGKITPKIQSLIDKEWKQHIHLLIATHYDDDHLIGLIEVLNTYPNLIIDKIWYNCGQKVKTDLLNKPLNEKKKKVIGRLRNELPPKVCLETMEITAESSLTLAEKILSKQSWLEAWTQSDYITSDTPSLTLPNEMGEIVVLSPDKRAIEALNQKYLEAFYEKFYTRYDGPYEDEETIFELIMRSTASIRDEEVHQINVDDFNSSFIQGKAQEENTSISPANKASIAFLWQKGEHRVLFLADADPRVVSNNIVQKSIFNNTIQKLDAIKVSHHGSKHNTSKILQNLIDSEHYFFTGGDEFHCRPSHESIARIISSQRADGIEKRILHFNYPTSIVSMYVNATEEIKLAMHFNALNQEECRHEIEF